MIHDSSDSVIVWEKMLMMDEKGDDEKNKRNESRMLIRLII